MNEEEKQKLNKRLEKTLEDNRIAREEFCKSLMKLDETIELLRKKSGYTKESIENHKYDYQAWEKERIRTHMNQISERIRTHMNQISMEKRRADIIAALMGQYACIRSTVALTNPDFGKILKIMKMEHTDENIYYIGDIANSLLKIIRNEE